MNDKPIEDNQDPEKKVKVMVKDRRFWARKNRPEATEDPQGKLHPTYVQELEEKVQTAEARLKERLAELDEENKSFRLRLEKDLERKVEERLVDYLRPVMDMLDDLDRMMAATGTDDKVTQGVLLTRNKLVGNLEKLGLGTIRPEIGQALDPHSMEACGLVPATSQAPSGTVQQVLQGGYRLADRVLFPARVTISQ